MKTKTANKATGIAIEQMDPAKLTPYPKNAKKHTKGQIAQVARSIKEFGFLQPAVVDKDGVVVVGHGRVAAALMMGLETIPVIRVTNLTDAQVDAYRLADNKLNESPWDMGLVLEELTKLSESGLDLLLTGFFSTK